MGTVISARTPGQIASEINFIKEQSGKMLLISAVEIGRRLTEAKKLVPHGEWIKWLEESVSYSRITAGRLMRMYREYGPKLLASSDGEDSPNDSTLNHLSYSQGLLLFGIPAEEREQFVADNDVETMSARELQQTVNEKEQAPEEREQVPEENDQNSGISQLTTKIQELEKQLEAYKQKYGDEQEKVRDGQKEPGEAVELIPVEKKISRLKPVRSAESINADSAKYEEQFAMHRDNMLSAYNELLKTLVSLDRIDPERKEAKREEALKIATNMAATLKKYPPKIETNLKLSTKD